MYSMLEAIQKIILDAQENLDFDGVARNFGDEHVPQKASVYIGVRRSGKSTYMQQIISEKIAAGARKEQFVRINFIDDRLHRFRTQEWELGCIQDAFASMYPNHQDTTYYFLDEIQDIPEWEYFVDRLLRTKNTEVYITGSSAKLLSTEIATQMRGRSLSWEVFPFSFEEFLLREQIEYAFPTSSRNAARIQAAFEQFWEFGGFPEVHQVSDALRVRIHQEYLRNVLYRDIVDRHNITHPNALLALVYRLLENVGTLHSINKLTAFLDDQGYKTHKTIVADYLSWLQDAYFIYSVTIFDASAARRNRTPKKIYAIDHALVRSVTPSILINSGHLFENYVFLALRRHTADIYYYKSKTGREVDFAVQDANRGLHCIQVSESIARLETREREVRSLLSALEEADLDAGYIITRKEEETIIQDNKKIQVLPAYKTEELFKNLFGKL